MIEVQTEVHLVLALLLLLVEAAAVIGVIPIVKVPCHRAPKSQVQLVVLVVVLVVVFPILLVAMLQLKLCLLVQSRMDIRVVTQSAAPIFTELVAVEQVLLV